MNHPFALRAIIVAAAVAAATPAAAIQQRSFVSITGSDLDACQAATPCRSLNAAIAQTLAGGEVIVLDSGGYGNTVIGKAIAIVAPPGIYAGISVASGIGVDVTAGSADVVTLRGLTINAQATGVTAVHFASGAQLRIEHSTLRGFGGTGIGVDAANTAGTSLAVIDCDVLDFSTAIAMSNATPPADIAVHGSRFQDNTTNAIFVRDNVTGVVRDSTFEGGANGLILLEGTPANPIDVVAEHNLFRGMSAVGVSVSGGANKALTINDNTFVAIGTTAIHNVNSPTSKIFTRANNTLSRNTADMSGVLTTLTPR